jgi:ubiquinone/menaquinone biosynthesis C-methylase UbiE
VRNISDAQHELWEESFSEMPDMFGEEPSYPARQAADLFKKEYKVKVLELGGGQGRDTLFFAQSGFRVHVVDYSNNGIRAITRRAQSLSLSNSIVATRHDVRKPLPFDDGSFNACYSHMLYSMALTTLQLESLSEEVRRVLKPKGLNVYTVRTTTDQHYGNGIHRGEDMYENDGFTVHFFSKEKVQLLAKGYQIISIDEFEEGELPRKLFLVTLRKNKLE